METKRRSGGAVGGKVQGGDRVTGPRWAAGSRGRTRRASACQSLLGVPPGSAGARGHPRTPPLARPRVAEVPDCRCGGSVVCLLGTAGQGGRRSRAWGH